MYGMRVLFCLIFTSRALGRNNTTIVGNVGPFEDRTTKDGDYVGCFHLGCLEFDYRSILQQLTTPDSCTASCKENGFKFAALYNRTECSCSCEEGCITKLPDVLCGLPCVGNLTIFCGGFTAASLYHISPSSTSKSKCGDNDVTSPQETDNPSSSVHISILISVFVVVFLIIINVVVILIFRRCRHTHEHEGDAVTVTEVAEQDRKTINKQLNLQGKGFQNRNSRTTNDTHYQPLNAKLQRPDLPQDKLTATVSPGAEAKEVIYEDPDLERSSVPTAGSELNHVYLVSGQSVPLKSSSSDEYHEYNYPDADEVKRKAYDWASKVDEDGYLVVEPALRSLPNPEANVYYCSRIHKTQIRGQDESFINY